MSRFLAPLALLSALFSLAPRSEAAAPITVATVPVGNAGHGPDPLTGNLYGGVGYDYRIGATEVTNDQYAAFLNEKAMSDPLALYSTSMNSDVRGGITRSGSSPNFTYAAKQAMGDKPVNFVSWYDAIRFANWLHNGQGSGDTETGAYTLGPLGAGGVPVAGASIVREPGAMWCLPSENEWYKAAYHQPAAQGGDADNYWLYPTASNTAPTIATATNVGSVGNPGSNVVNYAQGADWAGQNGNVTTVASSGPMSTSFYGTSDQAGNLWEWNEGLIGGAFRGIRGGSWIVLDFDLQSFSRSNATPGAEVSMFGFRVAKVPEPTAALLAMVACGIAYVLRKRLR